MNENGKARRDKIINTKEFIEFTDGLFDWQKQMEQTMRKLKEVTKEEYYRIADAMMDEIRATFWTVEEDLEEEEINEETKIF